MSKSTKNLKVAVLGLGLEGKDLVNFLQKQGYSLTIIDEKPKKELDLTEIKTKGLAFICGPNSFARANLQNFDIVFRSPGIYRFRKELVKAEKQGTKISSALKLFFDLCPAKIIGVTGTKGKGTTSTLIYEILKNSNKDVYLAGNIGKPYLGLLPKLKKDSWVVLELSSFQLIDLEKSPHIAVVLNITSDHLDWHKDREEYVDAKKNIVKHQKKSDFAILSKDYQTPKSFAKSTSQVVFFSKKNLQQKYRENLLLRGEHNLENISAAVTVAKILKIKDEVVTQVLRNFKGLEHRLELVREIKGVTFYNDSFATSPQPTMAALASFIEPTTVILGGYDKQLEYDELGRFIAKRKNVSTVILIGDTASKIKKSINKVRFKGKIIKLGKSKMEEIVECAFSETPKGGIVLLSPAAASFDMFKDYKERGEKFKQSVYKLGISIY